MNSWCFINEQRNTTREWTTQARMHNEIKERTQPNILHNLTRNIFGILLVADKLLLWSCIFPDATHGSDAHSVYVSPLSVHKLLANEFFERFLVGCVWVFALLAGEHQSLQGDAFWILCILYRSRFMFDVFICVRPWPQSVNTTY